jgi:glycosyltransferase involved in cell wall biosynthesis
MKAAVSIVIAAYNYGRYLGAALASVRAQTFPDWEALVVDDGSTDDTPAVAAAFLHDPRFRYVRVAHRGQPGAKNFGIRHTAAPLVAFLDADDIWLPRKLERQVARFESDRSLGLVFSARRIIDGDGFELEHVEPRLHRGDVLEPLLGRNFICFSSTVLPRRVLDEVGLFDEQLPLAIDYDLWLRVARRYRFDFVDEPLLKYRMGHASLSSRRAERIAAVGGILERFLQAPETQARLTPTAVRLARAEHCCDRAGVAHSRRAALGWYLRALRQRPQHAHAWRSLASYWWPASVRTLARKLLGKRDWQRKPRLA